MPHADLLGLDAAVHAEAAQGPVCQSGPAGAEELPAGDRGEEGGGARQGDEAEERPENCQGPNSKENKILVLVSA